MKQHNLFFPFAERFGSVSKIISSKSNKPKECLRAGTVKKCKRNTQAISARCELVHSVLPHAIPRVPGRNILKAKIVVTSSAKRTAAFSLVEMLMALLVASLLMAALAPVMTRRFSENISVSGSSHSINPILDEEGFECFNNPGALVTRKNRVPGILHVLMVSGGGGGGSASKGSEIPGNIIKAGSGSSAQTSAKVDITANMQDINIINLIGGGAGGGGAASYGISSNSVSTTGGKTETSALTGGCPLGSKWDNTKTNCVYTITPSEADYTSAYSACFSLNLGDVSAGTWRLPTQDEMTSKWTSVNPGSLTTGYYWTNEAYTSSGCSQSNRKAHRVREFLGGSSWGTVNNYNNCDSGHTHYYRCILPGTTTITIDTTVTQYDTIVGLSAFSGAGGGGAPYISNLKTQFPSVYNELQKAIKNNPGGKIYISAGNGGSGGSSTTSHSTRGNITSTSNGSNGSESCAIVTKPDTSTIAFKICAKGGIAGENRVKSTADNNIAAANNGYSSNGCYYQINNGTIHNFNCSGGNSGSNGINTNYKECTNSNTTGYNYAACSSTATGGNGGSGTSISGITYGAGGNGAGILISANGGSAANIKTPSVSASESGSPGYGRIDYVIKSPGNPGGGGAGGTMAIEHINTRGSNIEFQVKVGGGGLGGNSAADENGNPGDDGEHTTFKVIDKTNNDLVVAEYTVYGAKGGGGGKNDGAADSLLNPNPGLGGAQNTSPGLNLTAGSNFNTKQGGYILGIKGADADNVLKTGGDGGASGLTQSPLYFGGNSVNGWIGQGWDLSSAVGVPIGGVTIDSFRNVSKDKFPPRGGLGGGGGGFSTDDLTPGAGGNGMPGYVCVWWLNGQ